MVEPLPARLPSLVALRAFEAAARHRSLTRAAAELCVTHGAVSRHVKALEAALGVPLLRRGGVASEPTPEGARLAEGLGTAFGQIAATLAEIAPGPLTLSCSASIMLCWLIPRMPAFHAAHGDVPVELDASYDRVDFGRDRISAAIRSSTIPAPRDALIRDLGREWIGPVCAPDYLREVSLRRPEDLRGAALLATRTRPEAWRDWCAASGHPDLAAAPRRSFEHFYLMIQAASCGLGVAVVPHMLVIGEVKAGRLVAPFGFVPGQRALKLWIAGHLGDRPDLRALERWLVAEMRSIVPDPVDGVTAVSRIGA
ncbi:LysR substrate-binding domain-containing protein [Methylobacterium nonmethylotrophicum]|uniref:LysR family transcriptional regulator n=1 Tax=Methylobacterium nonmethylotrophicum TaxID=1141884 RepID=A0A4Z0NWC9_9HYPH|nr:LysR substrate-binding domain-containing protein [Methylobacterium nonmethylotrophicum]TGE01770.1 LysR family transcriptional regulator [Methylobacterium nonmethylotrophicum]